MKVTDVIIGMVQQVMIYRYVKKKSYKQCEFIKNGVCCPTQPSFNMEGKTIGKFCTSFQLNWQPTMQIWEIPGLSKGGSALETV